MKKNILLATGAILLSSSAFGTMARMKALGQNPSRGSFYISDTRNIFQNPAELNLNKNYIVTEWGAAGSAHGGFAKEMGSFAYGVYLNDTTSVETGGRGGTSNYMEQDNNLDLFFAGDMGIQWGARLHYSGSNDKSGTFDKSNSALGLGLGAIMGAMKGHVNVAISDKSEGGATAKGDTWKADSGINAGFDYKMGDMTFFGGYDSKGFTNTPDGQSNPEKEKETYYFIGAAKVHNLSNTSFVVMDIKVMSSSDEKTAAGATKKVTTTMMRLPLTIAFESDATSWLTLRGSLTQAIGLNSKQVKDEPNDTDVKSTNANTTALAAGATLTFGKLAIDGTVATGAGTFAFDSMLSEVSVRFNF